MIDLRSDTLTLPSREMLETILTAKLGDDGRRDENGRGEDKAVNELEDFVAELTGKDEAVIFSSGTLANTAAILTCCEAGDKVLVDQMQHIYVSEKVVFEENFGQLIPLVYRLNEKHTPDIDHLRSLMEEEKIKLLCIENTHNFAGGACIPLDELKEIYNLAKEFNIHVHMDGARLFNAAAGLDVAVEEICQYADSIMFCISKGLGAPLGSLLCGDKDFVKEVRNKKKLLGGNLRQAGIIAAPGMYALKNNIDQLKVDNSNAKYVADNLRDLRKTRVQEDVQTNIVLLDVSESNLSPGEYCALAKEKGLLVRPVLGDKVRLVFYNAISRADSLKIVDIIKEIDKSL